MENVGLVLAGGLLVLLAMWFFQNVTDLQDEIEALKIDLEGLDEENFRFLEDNFAFEQDAGDLMDFMYHNGMNFNDVLSILQRPLGNDQ